MARICYVIIAHDEPANLLGLIGSLWNPQDWFLIWLDAKADDCFVELVKVALRFGDNVQIQTGSVMVWGGFSIVDTTLRAYSQLRGQVGEFSHVVLCSGTHIPLSHPDAIFEEIRDLAGWMEMAAANVPVGPLSQVDSLMPHDWWWHMMRRIRYRYVEVPAMGMVVKGTRELWHGTVLLAGSQWHVLRSDLVDFIVHHHQRVCETFHDVVVADEHAFQWIVAQWPAIATVRRGAVAGMEWSGTSPRRLTWAEAVEKRGTNQFLFLRKAAAEATIDQWSEWAAGLLSNGDGAERLKHVTASINWGNPESARAPHGSHEPLLESLVEAVSRATDSKAALERLSEKRYCIGPRHVTGNHGSVLLVCVVQPKGGLALVPAVHRPPAADDPNSVLPGIPGHPDLVNVPIAAREYWTISETADMTDIESAVNDIFGRPSNARTLQPNSRSLQPDPTIDNRDWINQIVRDRSFADVGGLWGTVNERVSTALLAGAGKATMIDHVPLGHSLWQEFDNRCQRLGVSAYKCISIDAMRSDLREKVGSFDVVHCSGVIYHVPDLVAFVRNLVSISAEYLILQSMVVPDHIDNELGRLDLDGGQCLFVPLMNDTQRSIVGRHLERLGLHVPHLNGPSVHNWFNQGAWNYAPWSWLLTPTFLRGLLETCGLSVVEEGFVWEERTYSLLCRTPGGDPPPRQLPEGFSRGLPDNTNYALVDLSLHKRATQSSLSPYSVGTTLEEDASRAVSMDPHTPFAFHTNYEASPWWRVDLDRVCLVQQVVVTNRSESAYLAERAAPLLASTSLDGIEWSPLFATPDGFIPGKDRKPLIWTAAEPVRARFLRLSVAKPTYLHLRHVRVLGFTLPIADD